MDLDKIVSITGKPGLYRIVAETPTRFVVENVEDVRKKLSVGTNYQIAPVEKITLFTTTGEDPTLKDVFEQMLAKQEETQVPATKAAPNELKAYFKQVVPEYDESRVYPSDFKKIIKWFNIIQKANLA